MDGATPKKRMTAGGLSGVTGNGSRCGAWLSP